jgi:hypothetical protein
MLFQYFKLTESEGISGGKISFVGFEVLTAVTMRRALLWVATPCGEVQLHGRFMRLCCHHLQDKRRNKVTVKSQRKRRVNRTWNTFPMEAPKGMERKSIEARWASTTYFSLRPYRNSSG